MNATLRLLLFLQTSDPAGWGALASQGGFAVLAGFLGLLSYKIYQMADKVLNRALDVIEKGSATQASLAASVAANTAEIAGLRSGIHGVRTLMVNFETRLHEQEKR